MRHHVIPSRQWTGYSCTATMLQMCVRYFTGRRVSHLEAIRVTRCRPDGCSMAQLQKAMNKFGLKTRALRVGIRSIRTALDAGSLVVADDNKTYTSGHVILVTGHTRTRFWVIDPVLGFPTLPTCRRVIANAEESFVVSVEV